MAVIINLTVFTRGRTEVCGVGSGVGGLLVGVVVMVVVSRDGCACPGGGGGSGGCPSCSDSLSSPARILFSTVVFIPVE